MFVHNKRHRILSRTGGPNVSKKERNPFADWVGSSPDAPTHQRLGSLFRRLLLLASPLALALFHVYPLAVDFFLLQAEEMATGPANGPATDDDVYWRQALWSHVDEPASLQLTKDSSVSSHCCSCFSRSTTTDWLQVVGNDKQLSEATISVFLVDFRTSTEWALEPDGRSSSTNPYPTTRRTSENNVVPA